MTLERLRVIIEAQTSQYRQAMQNVQSQTRATTSVVQRQTNLIKSCLGKIASVLAVAFSIYAMVNFTKKCIEVASALEEVQNVVDVTFGAMSGQINEFAKTAITQYGLSELAAKKYASTMGAIVKSMGFTTDEAAQMSTTLTGLAGDIASFHNIEAEEAFVKLRAGITGETEPLKQLGINLTVANLQQYALTQGITKSYRAMTQQEQALLRYNYILHATKDAQGDFARTSDNWANQIRVLKQNFEQLAGIIGKSFIAALKPLVKALNAAMSHIINFATTVSNALGKIFGWKYDPGTSGMSDDLGDAAGSADDIAGGIGDAAKNAQKLNHQLGKFDELNVLKSPDSDDSDSGSGTGGGGAETDNGEWVKQDSIFKEFESEIDSLFKLGNYIRDALIGAMESINWDSIYEKARGFGKGLAEFLNGLLAYDGEGRTLFGTVAKTLAKTLNAIVYAAQAFLTEFDFYQLGVNIADGINNFFANFDFTALADAINKWVDGLQDMIKGFLDKIDWNVIFSGVKDFVSNLELDSMLVLGFIFGPTIISKAMAAGAKIAAAFTIIKVVLSTVWTFGRNIVGVFELMKNAGMTLGAAIKTIFGGAASVISGIVGVVGGAILAVVNFFDMLKNGFSWLNEILMVLGTALAAVGAIILGAPALVAGIVAAIVAAVGTLVVVVKDNWTAICNFIINMVTAIKSLVTKILELISSLIQKVIEKISEIATGLSDWFNDSIKPLFTKEKWGEILNNVITAFIETFTGIKEKVLGIFDDLWKGISSFFTNLKNTANSTVSGITNGVSGIAAAGQIAVTGVPAYATGGFPEDGLFFANHGEMVGKFSNGRTAVANNQQITQGIAQAVGPAVYDAVYAAMRNSNGNLNVTFKVEGDVNRIFKVMQQEAVKYQKRTGHEAFA